MAFPCSRWRAFGRVDQHPAVPDVLFAILPVLPLSGVLMGIAVFSRLPAIGAITTPGRAGSNTGNSFAAVRAVWQALTARFRPAPPPPVQAPFMLAAAARRLVPGVSGVPVSPHPAIKTVATHAFHTTASSQKQCQTVVKASSPRRLKVVREFDAGISPSCAGRMVISGRMADVCAELDRMAQKESATQLS